MPEGDPAGYLPNVKRSRRRRRGSRAAKPYQGRNKNIQNMGPESGSRPENMGPQVPQGRTESASASMARQANKPRPPRKGRYDQSSFNPFPRGGNPSAGGRIQRGADNRPNEGDSDWDPRRHNSSSDARRIVPGVGTASRGVRGLARSSQPLPQLPRGKRKVLTYDDKAEREARRRARPYIGRKRG